jgi:hypothetical protein
MRVFLGVFVLAAGLAVAAAGCGGGGGGVATPTIAPAKTFSLGGFQPAGPVEAGKPTVVSFSVVQPSGKTLTSYRGGPGPHTGVHLIIVDQALSSIIHLHPPLAADGSLRVQVVFPTAGRYRVVVDMYPLIPNGPPNFQLFETIVVKGKAPPPVPINRSVAVVDGYRFVIQGGTPHIAAIEPAFMTIDVTDPKGKPAVFQPFYGALAHAIFFRLGSLDYFHTHICSPSTVGCTSLTGTAPVGRSTKPGLLRAGILLPLPGTWRLFLQTQIAGRLITAPFTLSVR